MNKNNQILAHAKGGPRLRVCAGKNPKFRPPLRPPTTSSTSSQKKKKKFKSSSKQKRKEEKN